MRLCLIYNYAQAYRTAIFKAIDQEYDCDFFFGDSYLDVKKMDYSALKGKVTEVHNIRWRKFYYQRGVLPLLRKDYDLYLVFSQVWSISTWLFLLLARFVFHKKVYVWSHGWYGKESHFSSLLKKFLYKLPQGVFLYGNYARNLMIKEGFKPDRLFVIHNSLDYEQQKKQRQNISPSSVYQEHFGNSVPNLVFIGRLTQVKQLDLALKAMKQCNEDGVVLNMTFIGDGECKDKLVQLSRDLNLDTHTWFYGACYDEAVLCDLIYHADLCVSPGNVGLTAIHTMAFGTPVVTHNDFAHQMPEFEAVQPGVTGDFFVNNDVLSLSAVIKKWIEQNTQEKRTVIRNACITEIEKNWTTQFQMKVLKEHLI